MAATSASTKAGPSLPVGHCSSAPRSSSNLMTGKWAYTDGPTYTLRSTIRIGTLLPLAFGLHQHASIGLPGVQIEGRSLGQDMQFHADKAHGTTFVDAVHGRELHVGRVHHGDAARAFDMHGIVRGDERGGVFVQADPDRKRIIG